MNEYYLDNKLAEGWLVQDDEITCSVTVSIVGVHVNEQREAVKGGGGSDWEEAAVANCDKESVTQRQVAYVIDYKQLHAYSGVGGAAKQPRRSRPMMWHGINMWNAAVLAVVRNLSGVLVWSGTNL